MKEFLQRHGSEIKHILGFFLFVMILGKVFFLVTYLFRGNQYSYNDRISVVGVKEEERNSLDVIYIGGSAAFVYWMPLKAYSDCGFTSYDLATNTLQAESILAYIKYAEKYQHPDLYIVGVRAFQYYSEQGNEVGLRITSDALDIGFNRFELIRKYLSNRMLETDQLALYCDIAKYHTNYAALSNPTAWRLLDNSEKSTFKGCQLQTAWCYLEKPQNFQTEERAALSENNKKTLHELLDYCNKKSLKVLFVVCPYVISQEEYSIYNSLSDMVTSYGYDFLNTNDYYDEMNIDFAQDFYNRDHVNNIGAEKYTNFLEKYLCENYSLPDHRGDGQYSEWDELALEFGNTLQSGQNTIFNMIAQADEAVALKSTITDSNNFASWSNLVNDSRYTIAAVGNGTFFEKASYESKKLLNELGLSDLHFRDNYINISSATVTVAANSQGEESCTVKIGNVQQQVPCAVENTNQACSIVIDGKECSRKDPEGLNVVVFDNYYRTIIDSVCLKCNEGGAIEILR